MTLKEFLENSRINATVKTVLVGLICVLIGEFFHLDGLYFSVLLSYLLMTMFKGQVFSAAYKVLTATVIMGFLSVAIALLFYDNKLVYLILSCLLIFLIVILIPLFNIGAIVGGIVASVILFFTTFNGVDSATETYYMLCTQFFVTFVVASFIDRFVLPVNPGESLKITLGSAYLSLKSHFKSLNALFGNERISDKEITLDTFNHIRELIRLTDNNEKDRFRQDLLVKTAAFTKEIYIKSELIRSILEEDHSIWLGPDIENTVKHLNSNVSEALDNIHRAWTTGSSTYFHIIEIYTGDMEKDIMRLEASYTELHDKKGEDAQYYEKLLSFGSLIELYKVVILKLNKINSALNKLNDPRDAFYSSLGYQGGKSINLSTDYRHSVLNPGNIIQSIKIIIITLIVLFGELYFKWPGGFQVTFFAVLFGIIPNIGQVHQKARVAIEAVFVSILYGLVCLLVLSQVQNFLLFLLFFVLGSFIFSYLANGTGSSSYGWLHALLIVPFSLLVTNVGVVDDMFSAVQRGMALIVVACVGLLVQHYIWPVIPEKQLRHSIQKSINMTGEILEKLLRMDMNLSGEVKKLITQQSNSLPTINTLFNDAKYLVNTDDENTAEFLKIVERIEFLYIQVESLYKSIYAHLDNELVPLHLNHMKKQYGMLCTVIQEVGDQFENDAVLDLDFAGLTEDFISHRQIFRDSDVWRKFSADEIEVSVFIAKSIDDIMDSINVINRSVNLINEDEADGLQFDSLRTAEG